MNKVSSLIFQIRDFILNKHRSILGIDIGSGTIKIVELTFTDIKPILKQSLVIDLLDLSLIKEEPTWKKQCADLIHNAILVNGIKSKHAIISVGGHNIFSREITLPKLTKEELTEAIKWDIEKQVPYEEGSYYYDFSLLGTNSNTKDSRLMLVASPKKVINDILSIFQFLPIHILAIDGEAFAIERTLHNENNCMVIDIGKENSQMIIYQSHIPVLTRNIPIFGDRFTASIMSTLNLDRMEAELLKKCQWKTVLKSPLVNESAKEFELRRNLQELIQELANEVMRTLTYYQAQNREGVIQKILLCGGGSRLENLAENLKGYLNIPVEILMPLPKLTIADTLDPQYVKEMAPQLTIAIGLALRESQ